MATEHVSSTEAKRRWSELIERAAYGGERFVVESHDKPLVAIVSYEDLGRLEMTKDERIGKTREVLAKLDELRARIAARTSVKFDAVKDLEEIRRERLEQLVPD